LVQVAKILLVFELLLVRSWGPMTTAMLDKNLETKGDKLNCRGRGGYGKIEQMMTCDRIHLGDIP